MNMCIQVYMCTRVALLAPQVRSTMSSTSYDVLCCMCMYDVRCTMYEYEYDVHTDTHRYIPVGIYSPCLPPSALVHSTSPCPFVHRTWALHGIPCTYNMEPYTRPYLEPCLESWLQRIYAYVCWNEVQLEKLFRYVISPSVKEKSKTLRVNSARNLGKSMRKGTYYAIPLPGK